MLINDTQQKRLRLFAMAKFGKIKDFAEAMGMTSQGINPYITDGGRVLQRNEHREKLKDLGLNLDWYYYGTGEMLNNKGANDNLFDNLKSNVQPSDAEEFARRQNTQNGSYLVKIQHALIAVNSGIPVDSKQEYITMEKDMSVSKDAKGFNVVSDEMSPTLSPRHYVIIEPVELRVDNIAVFKIGKNYICRRIKLIDGETITLTADNKAYKDFSFKREDAEYIGTVVNIQLADV